ncbi:MAG: hypothetical protein COV45_04655 [Deltaproteobacteria bacterium CG11_big_fil_rev_8_21_14_0_20_47_16]|nr:MAG: hypothetical protein COV45_04655 [Deltaproteobacteria bacterium CG11_big_fil_rev_8_21_14_0_20_47_16]
MKHLKPLLILGLLFISGCGGAQVGADTVTTDVDPSIPTGLEPPLIFSISPTTAARGDTVTLTGIGFSTLEAFDIVMVGTNADSVQTTGIQYGVASAGETLTFVIPADAPLGLQNIAVLVITNLSNADKQMTITP